MDPGRRPVFLTASAWSSPVPLAAHVGIARFRSRPPQEFYPKRGSDELKKDTTRGTQAARGKDFSGFSEDERAAMKERAQELKAEARRKKGGKQADGESDLLAKIAEMAEPDRAVAERLHALVKASAPELAPRTWYGMPAYALDGKVVLFFQAAHKFKTRYSTLGFSDQANLDDGEFWPTSFAIDALTPAVEKKIAALVKQAVKR